MPDHDNDPQAAPDHHNVVDIHDAPTNASERARQADLATSIAAHPSRADAPPNRMSMDNGEHAKPLPTWNPTPRPFSYGIGAIVNPSDGVAVVRLDLFFETGHICAITTAVEMGELGVKLVDESDRVLESAKLWRPPPGRLILPPDAQGHPPHAG